VTGHLRFAAGVLRQAVDEALMRRGVPPHVRAVEADLMVEAELHGVPSHGLLMLPRLLAGLREGRANPDPKITVVRDAAAVCVMDGDRGPGRYVGVEGMRAAMARARQFGMGACLAVETTHWGRAHAYACLAAEGGFVGLCTTNAIPNMLVPGAARPVLGNNPIAIAAPRGPGQHPIVLDLAMSQAALGKVATAQREGQSVPRDWGLDADGRPTADPAAILASQNLLPMGGHKGAGLAMMMEILTAALGGSLFSHEVADADRSGLDAGGSKLFVAIDPGAFGDAERFYTRVGEFAAHVRAGVDGGEAILPGERGWRTRAEFERDGIPVHPDVAAALGAVGVSLVAG
jgi:LDH2 family malate/lactate/ureidoglycolate dehydrogenase